jgi:tetratricopeptide (TPR) repeat protein
MLSIIFVALLATFGLTSGWRRRLQEESAKYRRLVAEVERARTQQKEQASEESTLEDTLRDNPDNAAARLQLAHLRLTRHGAPAALPVLQPVEEKTHDPRLLRALAECYRLIQREDKTLALLERAALFAPEDGDVQVDRALLFSLLLYFREAEDALRKAERLGADPRQISLVRGMMEWQEGNYRKARQILQAALRQYPNDPLLVRQLTMVANSEGRYEEAVQLLEQLGQQQNDVEVMVSLVKAYLGLTDKAAVEKSIATARKVLAIRPHHAQAQLMLGRALRRIGKIAEAQKVLETLRREQPNMRGVAFELFEIYRAQGRNAEAQPLIAQHRKEREHRSAMRQAVTVFMAFPERATSHRDIAAACLEHGLYGRAIIACERALVIDPQLPSVKAMLAEAKKKVETSAPTEVRFEDSIVSGGDEGHE